MEQLKQEFDIELFGGVYVHRSYCGRFVKKLPFLNSDTTEREIKSIENH
jgi:hypothetical protein